MATHAVLTVSTTSNPLLPNNASHAASVRLYSPNTTGTVTGTLAFVDGPLSYPMGAFSIDAKGTVILELALDLSENQNVTIALDAAPTTQLSCFTTYR